jgi:hypothetical protein
MFSRNLTAVTPPPPFLEGLSEKDFLPVISFMGKGGALIDTCAFWLQKDMAFVVFIGISIVPGSNKSISRPASPSPLG